MRIDSFFETLQYHLTTTTKRSFLLGDLTTVASARLETRQISRPSNSDCAPALFMWKKSNIWVGLLFAVLRIVLSKGRTSDLV
jgi:hypothetical protein